jgi:hypothetical protein
MVTKLCFDQLALIQNWGKSIATSKYLDRIESNPEFYGRIDFAMKTNPKLDIFERERKNST